MNQLTIKRAITLSISCVILSALFFPADNEMNFQGLYSWGDLIADIQMKRKVSEFPAALVVSYFMAIGLGVGLAVISYFSPAFAAFQDYVFSSRRRIDGFILVIGSSMLPLALVFLHIEPIPGTSAARFFSLVADSRIALALWCIGVWFLFYAPVLALFAWIKNISVSLKNG